MGYHGSTGAVTLQTGSYQRGCYAQPDMDYSGGRRKADDHAEKKWSRMLNGNIYWFDRAIEISPIRLKGSV